MTREGNSDSLANLVLIYRQTRMQHRDVFYRLQQRYFLQSQGLSKQQIDNLVEQQRLHRLGRFG